MDNLLLRNVAYNKYERAEGEDFDNTKVFKVEGKEDTLFYWNSSNSGIIDHPKVLRDIQVELIDGNDAGTVRDGFKEIMYEVR